MAIREIRDRQAGFAAGLNTTSDLSAFAESEFRIGTNTQLSLRGAARKRGGTQQVLASALSAHPVQGGVGWSTTAATSQLVIQNGKLWTGTLAIPLSLTDRGGSFSPSVYPTFAAFRGPSSDGVYIADGGLLNFWDGTTLTSDIANTPAVDAICAWGPRLFGVSGDTLYWSDTTGGVNGHTLGAVAGGGTAIVRTYGGQSLVMPFPLKNSLLLFHRRAISRFTGATQEDIDIDAGIAGISGDVGTVAKRSIIGVENAAYFLTDRGAFAASEMSVDPISSPLEATLSTLSQSQWNAVSAVHARRFNEIRWLIPDVGVYVYNYRTQGWTGPWTGAYLSPDVTAMWDTVDSDGVSVALLGTSDGHVLWADRANTWKDAVLSDGTGGTAYRWCVQCKRFFGQDYTQFKSWRWAYILGAFDEPEAVTIDIGTDAGVSTIPLPYDAALLAMQDEWGASGTQWGAPGSVWRAGVSTSSPVERAKIPINGTYPWVDLTFCYTGDQACTLSIVDVLGFERRRR